MILGSLLRPHADILLSPLYGANCTTALRCCVELGLARNGEVDEEHVRHCVLAHQGRCEKDSRQWSLCRLDV